MSNIKKCNTCGTEYEFNDIEELREYFYWKSGYFMGNCKVCERKKTNDKYKDGTYVRKGKVESYRYHDLYRMGNNFRCSKRQRSNYRGEKDTKKQNLQKYEGEME